MYYILVFGLCVQEKASHQRRGWGMAEYACGQTIQYHEWNLDMVKAAMDYKRESNKSCEYLQMQWGNLIRC